MTPFPFIRYINDLVWHMAVLNPAMITTMYADDTTLKFTMNSEGLSEIEQADTIMNHCKQSSNSDELFLNNKKLKCSLGINLNSSLSSSFHIENLCSKLCRPVYAIKVSQAVDTEAAGSVCLNLALGTLANYAFKCLRA
nr:unnamed protein product [Callosobruchus analis]